MKVKTQLKAGGVRWNHNQTLRVKSNVSASGLKLQHNQALQGTNSAKAGLAHKE